MNSFYEKSRTALARIFVLLLAISVGTVGSPIVVFSQEESATTTATTTVDVTPAEIVVSTEEVIVEEIIEEDEEPSEAVPEYIPQNLPVIPMREVKKAVHIDNEATHRCEAESFRIDISENGAARTRIMLEQISNAPYEMEIGAMPNGIEMTFSKNRGHRYSSTSKETGLDLEITSGSDSQKGDFTIPVVFTQKSGRDSSVICQINIVNR